jgi:hypothetical protein
MSQEKKPSLKKAKQEVKKAILVLSSNQSQLVDESVSLIERVYDEEVGYTKTRGELISLIAEKFAGIVGTNPTYALWNLAKESIMNPVLSARGIDEPSFNSNIWNSVTTYCEKEFLLIKPKSVSADAERQAKRREELAKMSIAELEEKGLFKEAGARKEKEAKEKVNKENEKYDKMKKAIKAFMDKATHKELVLFNTITNNIEPFAKFAESLKA